MDSKILKLEKEYGDTALHQALHQIFREGLQAVSKKNMEEYTEALQEPSENPIVTPEIQIQTRHCLNKLATMEPHDILSYIKTRLPVNGVTVHEGKNICVRWDGTNDLILYCTVPGDTDLKQIDKVEKKLDEIVEAYSIEDDENGDGFDYIAAIWEAFLAVGLRPKFTEVDRMIYV